jgi:hypothetical protein
MAPWTSSRFQLVMVILKKWWHEQEKEEHEWQSFYQDWEIDSDDNMIMRERDPFDFEDYLATIGSDSITEYDLGTLIFEETTSPAPEDYEQAFCHNPDSPVAHDLELEYSIR